MVKRITQSVLPRHQPLLSRESYSREMASAFLMPVPISLTEGAVVSILAKQIFSIGEFQFATIMAAPMFANLTSFIWSQASHGRPKVWMVTRLQMLLLVTVASIGFLPASPAGSWSLVGLVVLARCLIAGMVTTRSTIWRNNYPRHIRGRLTGHMVFVAMIILTITPLIVYNLMDLNQWLFRVLYPICAVFGIGGIIAFSGIRLRRERELLRRERESNIRLQPRGETEPYYSEETEHPLARFAFFRILRDDKQFRKYMLWQFFAGMGNMAGETAMVWYIVQWTRDMEDPFGTAVIFNATLPFLVAMLTLPFWGRLLDRCHITKYRTRHGVAWLVSQSTAFIAAMSGNLWWWLIPRLSQGCMRGGGMLAWQLGHNDFAKRENVASYMGIHVTLTGIRGATMPFLGTLLVAGLDDVQFGGISLPKWDGIGPYTFLITFTLCLIAYIGYLRMARDYQQENPTGPPQEN